MSFIVLVFTSTTAISPIDMSSKSPYSTSSEDIPSSCKPVFLSSLARHGSRTASSESKYLGPQQYLEEAANSNLLTVEGQSVLRSSKELYTRLQAQNISWGGLTTIGENEHYNLGRRTFRKFGRLFQQSEQSILAESTYAQRTQDSLEKFIDGIVSEGGIRDIFSVVEPPSCDPEEEVRILKYAELRFFDVCEVYQLFKNNNPFVARTV